MLSSRADYVLTELSANILTEESLNVLTGNNGIDKIKKLSPNVHL